MFNQCWKNCNSFLVFHRSRNFLSYRYYYTFDVEKTHHMFLLKLIIIHLLFFRGPDSPSQTAPCYPCCFICVSTVYLSHHPYHLSNVYSKSFSPSLPSVQCLLQVFIAIPTIWSPLSSPSLHCHPYHLESNVFSKSSFSWSPKEYYSGNGFWWMSKAMSIVRPSNLTPLLLISHRQ